MRHASAGPITAHGDTVKTSIGTITIPKTVKKICGVWCYAAGGAGLTTLENLSGIFELESPDINLQPLALPLDIIACLTEGAGGFRPSIFPVDIPVGGGERVTCYVTIDMAQTVAGTCRFGLLYE